MKCPECEKQMKWIGDSEDTNEDTYSYYACDDCTIDVFKYYKTEIIK